MTTHQDGQARRAALALAQPPQITGRWEFITPALAAVYLALNVHNRTVRSRQVQALARDMKNGFFDSNGETIKFDTEGNLIDGQHRLHGVIEAGVGVWMYVMRGVSVSAQETIDAGIKRGLGDILKLRGEENYNRLATVCRAVAQYESGGVVSTNAVSTSEALRVLDEYPCLRDGATVVSNMQRRGLLTSAVAGALWWKTQLIDPVDSDYFFKRLVEAADHHPGEPIYALRMALLRADERRGTRPIRWMFGLSAKSWNKFRRGELAHQLRFVEGGANAEAIPELV